MAIYDPLSRTPTELLEKMFSLIPRLLDVLAPESYNGTE